MREKNVLNQLYEKAMELSPTKEFWKLDKIYQGEKEKLLKEVGEKYLDNLEDVTNAHIDMNNELCRQMYCEGFKTATELLIEIFIDKEKEMSK